MQNQLKEDNNYTIEYATEALNRNIGWINSADNKASILIAVVGFIFGGSSLLINTEKVFKLFENGDFSDKVISIFLMLLFCLFSVAFILTLVNIFKTLLIRVIKSKSTDIDNIHFFKDISKMTYENYIDKINKITKKDVLNELLAQIYETARIANIKHLNLHYSYKNLTFAIVAFLIYSLIVAFL